MPLLYMVAVAFMKDSWRLKWMTEWPQLEAINSTITTRVDMEVLEQRATWGCSTAISKSTADAYA